MSKLASHFNAKGEPMNPNLFMVPLVYLSTIRHKNKDAELVIAEMTKNKVVVAWRSNKTNKMGLMKHIPIQESKGQHFFMLHGNKIALGQGKRVM